jgi:nucleoside-diphosphate-sugar epimerase
MILLTGATGFLGGHLAERFCAREPLLVLVRRGSDRRHLETLKNVTFVEGDLSDVARMRDIFSQYRPEVVIHSAWSGAFGGRDSQDQYLNFLNTKNLFENCAAYGCRRVIGIGSQAEYGIHNCALTETAQARPAQLYGIYKLSAGLLGQHYAVKYGFDYAWLRLFAAFGPRDYKGYFIPSVIASLLEGRSPELTECTQTWDYLYVKDAAALVERVVLYEGRFCGIYNLCSGRPVVLKEVVSIIREILRTTTEAHFGVVPLRPDGLLFLLGDATAFQTAFGQVELTPLRDALEQTVREWK